MSGSHIGKRLFVADGRPATNDAAGFVALTWVEVNGLQSLPQFGINHADIDVPDLTSGIVGAVKGAGTGNDTSATFRLIPSDAGQIDLRDHANATGDVADCSIKVVGPCTGSGIPPVPATGDPVIYAQGYAKNYVENQGDTTTFEGFSVGFRQSDTEVYATQPAP